LWTELAGGHEHAGGHLAREADLVGALVDADAVALLGHGDGGAGVDAGGVELAEDLGVGLDGLTDAAHDHAAGEAGEGEVALGGAVGGGLLTATSRASRPGMGLP